MLSENSPDPGTEQPEPRNDPVEPIAPDEAEAILQQALEPYREAGWHVLHMDAYSARLTRGVRNVDIRVDLLGEITVTESNLTPLQQSGRLTAWIVLLAMLLVALALFSALGVL